MSRNKPLELTRDFFEMSSQMHAVTDLHGSLILFNSAWTETLGWTAKELEGHSVLDFVHPKNQTDVAAEFKQLFLNDCRATFESDCLTKEGGYQKISWRLCADSKKEIIFVTGTINPEKNQKAVVSTSDKLNQVRVDEQIRIAQNIHDTLGQTLPILKLNIQNLLTDISYSRQKKLIVLVDSIIQDAQTVSKDLQVSRNVFQSLDVSLPLLIKEYQSLEELQLVSEVSLLDTSIPSKYHYKLYLIIQELLTNTLKHSKASKVTIHSKVSATKVILTISDNGVGFDPDQPTSQLGLSLVKKRVKQINAKLEFDSDNEQGSRVQIVLQKNKNN